MMRVSIRQSCAGLLLCAIAVYLPGAAEARPPGRVSLRNCVQPDLLTNHELTTTILRTSHRGEVTERSIVEFTSRLIRAHLDESQPGRVKVADMLLTQPGRVVSLVRNGKPVSPLPGPEAFNLSLGSATLRTRIQNITDGPV